MISATSDSHHATAEAAAIRFVDTHAHLDEPAFDRDRDAVLLQAAAVGVTEILNIAYRPARWESSALLAAQHANVGVAVGLHPHHANEFTITTCDEIAAWIDRLGARALGEIGLDYFRDGPEPHIQRQAFAAQLELATQFELPVVIHQRAAEDDLIDVLRHHPGAGPIILHSFDGTRRLATFGLDRGCFFGVGGLMTRPPSDALRAIIADIPADRLLLETDSPYLKPAGAKGSRNVPANIPLIAASLAALRGWTVEEVARHTTWNADRLFRLRPVTEPATTR